MHKPPLPLRIGLVFLAIVALAASPLRAELPCAADANLVAHDDYVKWPSHLQQGESTPILPLANDSAPAGGVTSVSFIADPFGLGQAVTLADGRTVQFTPSTPATYPGDGKYLSYNVTSSTGGTQPAKIYFTRDSATDATPDFVVNCDPETPNVPSDTPSGSSLCNFMAHPAITTNVRSFDWRFAQAPGCNKVDWRAWGTMCTFPPVPIGQISSSMDVTLTVHYFDRASVSRTKTVFWTPEAPALTWDILPPNPGGDGSDGLAVVAKLRCPTCNPCTGGPNPDQLWWKWCDTCDVVPVFTSTCGGGNLAFPSRVRHTYAQPGVYRAEAWVLRGGVWFRYPDNGGGSYGKDIEVLNNAPEITVSAGVASDNVDANTSVRDDVLIDLAYPAMTPSRIEWDYGDGTSEAETGPFTANVQGIISRIRQHQYAKKGRYAVTVRATDAHGATATAKSADFDITNLAPKPDFFFTCTGLTCQFDASATTDPEGQTIGYGWYLGTTYVSSSVQMTHTFPAAGNYTMSLYTIDSDGGRGTTLSRRVSVTSEVVAPLLHWNNGKPCRVYDSRTGSGTKLQTGTTYPLSLTSNDNPCTIPPDTTAMLLTVTAVSPSGPGYVKVWGAGTEPEPPAVVFEGATTVRSNSVTVRFANPWQRDVSIRPTISGGTPPNTHIVIDVAGFYTSGQGIQPACVEGYWCGPMTFQPLPQCRLYDSRLIQTLVAPGSTTQLSVIGTCGLKSSMLQTGMALSMNVTAVPLSDGAMVAYDSAFPPSAVTTATTLPFKNGRVQSIGTIARVGSRLDHASDLAITNQSGSAHQVIDINGAFSYLTGAAGELYFYPIQPCRVFDTRNALFGNQGKVVSGTPLSVAVAGNCGVPKGAKAAVISTTIVMPQGQGYLRLYPSSTAPPFPPVINFMTGDIIGNATIVELSKAQKDVTMEATIFGPDATAETDVVLDVFGYFAPRTP